MADISTFADGVTVVWNNVTEKFEVPNQLAIGRAVGGGAASRVLFADAAGNLGQSANLPITIGPGGNANNARLDIGATGQDGNGGLAILGTGRLWFGAPGNGRRIADNNGLELSIANVAKMLLPATAGAGAEITAGTATTDVNALKLTQTWNNGSQAFNAIDLDATDTASASSSKLLRLRRNGSEVFSVRRDGRVASSTTIHSGSELSAVGPARVSFVSGAPAGGAAGLLWGGSGGFGVYAGSGVPTISAAQGSLYLRSDGSSTSTRLYVNTDGGTTWTAVTTVT